MCLSIQSATTSPTGRRLPLRVLVPRIGAEAALPLTALSTVSQPSRKSATSRARASPGRRPRWASARKIPRSFSGIASRIASCSSMRRMRGWCSSGSAKKSGIQERRRPGRSTPRLLHSFGSLFSRNRARSIPVHISSSATRSASGGATRSSDPRPKRRRRNNRMPIATTAAALSRRASQTDPARSEEKP